MTDAALSFGPFHLDPAERRLTRYGEQLEVSARYLDALILLASERGRLVTKNRFLDEVWRGVPVTDEALTQCVRALRRALGDDAASPRFIETVPRYGYRFIAPVEYAGELCAGTMRATTRRPTTATRDIFAATLGGGAAGMVGALGYVGVGLVTPEIGAASTLLVLLSVNLMLGIGAGLFVGAGIALPARGGALPAASIVGAAAGGLLVGAISRMVGSDLLTLFFGRVPSAMTGAGEGLALGAATGLAAWFALRPGCASLARLAAAPALGALAGIAIALAGGRLMIGSLAALASGFPQSNLRIEELSPVVMALTTSAEGALFAGGVVAAIAAAHRLASDA